MEQTAPKVSITEDFVKTFEEDAATYTSMLGKMVAINVLPTGVDPADERVKQIIAECSKRNHG